NARFRRCERRAARPTGGLVVIPVDARVAGSDDPAARREGRLSVDLKRANPGQQADSLACAAPTDTAGEAHRVLRAHIDQIIHIIELVERAIVAPGLARRCPSRDRPLTRAPPARRVLIHGVVHLRAVRPYAADVVHTLLGYAELRLDAADALRHPLLLIAVV